MPDAEQGHAVLDPTEAGHPGDATVPSDAVSVAPARPDDPVVDRRRTRSGLAARLTPLAVGLFSSLLVLYQLFGFSGSPVIGVADNGDGGRLACQLSVVGAPPVGTPRYWSYVVLAWQHSSQAWATCPKWITSIRYPTSEFFLVRAARWLSGVLGFSATLDLRALGLLCALVVGVLVGLLCTVLPGRLGWRVAVSIVVALIIADGAFAPFFISMFSQPAALLGVLALCVAWLWSPRPIWQQAVGYVAIAVAGAAVAFNETAFAPLAVVIALALVARRLDVRALWPRVAVKAVATVMAAALCGGLVVFLHFQSRSETAPQTFEAVFDTLLLHSPNRQADLRWLGAPPELAKYAGSDYYGSDNPIARHDPNYAIFLKHFSWWRLAEFYATHPAEAAGLYHRQGSEAATMRDPTMGNYAIGEGAPPLALANVLACRFCSVSSVVPQLEPIAWLLIPLWVLFVGGVGVVLATRRRGDANWRSLGELLVLLPVMAVVLLFSSALVNGDVGAIKHDVVFDATMAVMVPLVGLAIVGVVETQWNADGSYRPGRLLRSIQSMRAGAQRASKGVRPRARHAKQD